MLRVGYGVTVLAAAMQRGGADGIANVSRELLRRLNCGPALEVVPFEFARTVSGQIPGALPVGGFQSQALISLVTSMSFPVMRSCVRGRVDLVHATDHYIPRLRGVPVLATLMDAIPLSHPNWVDYRFRSIKNEAWRRSARWADHVLTISEFSRGEIARWFRLREERISVIPLGVDARWFQRPAMAEIRRMRAAYALPEHFFLFVGTLQPRKNLELLVKAHGMLPASVREQCPLIVVGRRGWGCDALVASLESKTLPDVRWLQYVPDEDLPVMLSLATALLFPSLYEGFGLPVLEAFAAGTPVLASNATAIPEVAGNAAVLLDPADPLAWRDAMDALLASDEQRHRLQSRRWHRAAAYDWARCAEQVEVLYQRVVMG